MSIGSTMHAARKVADELQRRGLGFIPLRVTSAVGIVVKHANRGGEFVMYESQFLKLFDDIKTWPNDGANDTYKRFAEWTRERGIVAT